MKWTNRKINSFRKELGLKHRAFGRVLGYAKSTAESKSSLLCSGKLKLTRQVGNILTMLSLTPEYRRAELVAVLSNGGQEFDNSEQHELRVKCGYAEWYWGLLLGFSHSSAVDRVRELNRPGFPISGQVRNILTIISVVSKQTRNKIADAILGR